MTPAKFKRHCKFTGKRLADLTIPLPFVFEMYYRIMPKVDQHNARRQGYLNLEQAFKVQDAFIRFFSCFYGVIIINAFLGGRFISNNRSDIWKETQTDWVEKLAMEMLGWKGELQSFTDFGAGMAVRANMAAAVACEKPCEWAKIDSRGSAMKCSWPSCKSCTNPGRTMFYCRTCYEAHPNFGKEDDDGNALKIQVSKFAYCGSLESVGQKERKGSSQPAPVFQRGCMLRHAVEQHAAQDNSASSSSSGNRRNTL